MLPAGDVDTFETVLEFYLQMLPFAKARTQTYFNHSGIFFTETKTNFAAYRPIDYGCNRPAGYPVYLEDNNYLHYDFGGDAGGPEVSLMALDHFMYTGNESAWKRYSPIVYETIKFFSQHYPKRDANGKMVIFPTQALETYWCYCEFMYYIMFSSFVSQRVLF